MRRSLFTTLAVVITVTVVLIMSALGAFSYVKTKAAFEGEMKHRASLSIVTLKKNVAGLMEAYAPNEYEKLVATELQRRNSFPML